MKISLPFVVLTALSLSTACVRSPMLSNGGDVSRPSAMDDADEVAPEGNVIEMPPLYVDGRERVGRRIKKASAAAVDLCSRQLNCPAVRVVRADLYRRTDGTLWTVIRLNACGEERVYEQTPRGWNDASSRLR